MILLTPRNIQNILVSTPNLFFSITFLMSCLVFFGLHDVSEYLRCCRRLQVDKEGALSYQQGKRSPPGSVPL